MTREPDPWDVAYGWGDRDAYGFDPDTGEPDDLGYVDSVDDRPTRYVHASGNTVPIPARQLGDPVTLFHLSLFPRFRESFGGSAASVAWTYLAIRSFLNTTSGEAFPSRKAIAAVTGQSVVTVSRNVAALESAGIVEVIRSDNQVNHYRIPSAW